MFQLQYYHIIFGKKKMYLIVHKYVYTNEFAGEVKLPVPSEPNITMGLAEPPLCCSCCTDIASPGVWVEGVEGAELGEGPAVFAVPELLALPEDEPGFFLFFAVWTTNSTSSLYHSNTVEAVLSSS